MSTTADCGPDCFVTGTPPNYREYHCNCPDCHGKPSPGDNGKDPKK